MTANEVLSPRCVSPVASSDERGVLVPLVVGDDPIRVAVPSSLDRVGVAPVVEGGQREPDSPASGLVDAECGVLPDSGEQQGIIGEVSGVIRENLPSPELGRTSNAVSPRSLPASSVDGAGLEINVPALDTLNDLPLGPKGRHEGFESAVGHWERTDESFGLYAVQPAGIDLVGGSTLDITYDIGRDDVRTTEPLPEGGEGGMVSVLRTPATGEFVEEARDPRLRKVCGREGCICRDHAADLDLVLGGLCGPRFDQRREIGTSEGGKKAVQLASRGVVVDESQLRTLFDDCTEGRPFAFMVEILDESLYIVRHFTVRSTAREKPRPAIIERDPGLPPLGALRSVRHGQENGIAATQPATSSGETTLTKPPKSMEYPGGGSNPYDLWSRDFERPGSLNPRNDLAHPYSSAPSRIRTEADSNGQSFATYLATSHGVSQLSRVLRAVSVTPVSVIRSQKMTKEKSEASGVDQEGSTASSRATTTTGATE